MDIKVMLKRIITEKTVFVCIGSDKVLFDIFGPLCGTLLAEYEIPHYGEIGDPVNAINMYEKLHQIYDIDGIDDCDIIAIDASMTSNDNKINKLELRPFGVQPGAGMGRKFPKVGEHSLVMYTLLKCDLQTVINYYNELGVDKGYDCDLADEEKINIQAQLLVGLIAEIYNEINTATVK